MLGATEFNNPILVHPHYLVANASSHTTPFNALAELLGV